MHVCFPRMHGSDLGDEKGVPAPWWDRDPRGAWCSVGAPEGTDRDDCSRLSGAPPAGGVVLDPS